MSQTNILRVSEKNCYTYTDCQGVHHCKHTCVVDSKEGPTTRLMDSEEIYNVLKNDSPNHIKESVNSNK